MAVEGSSEQGLQDLGDLVQALQLPLDSLQLVAASEQGSLVLDRVREQLLQKNRELEEYESALNDLTQSMNQQACEWCALNGVMGGPPSANTIVRNYLWCPK